MTYMKNDPFRVNSDSLEEFADVVSEVLSLSYYN